MWGLELVVWDSCGFGFSMTKQRSNGFVIRIYSARVRVLRLDL